MHFIPGFYRILYGVQFHDLAVNRVLPLAFGDRRDGKRQVYKRFG
jgi:hypothetical protein